MPARKNRIDAAPQLRQDASICLYDARRESLGATVTAKRHLGEDKYESDALDNATPRRCNFSARASENTSTAVLRELDYRAMQIDRWPVSPLPGERRKYQLSRRRSTIQRITLHPGFHLGI
jgi:hypothetical protein